MAEDLTDRQIAALAKVVAVIAVWGILLGVVITLKGFDRRIRALEHAKSDRGELSPAAVVRFRWWSPPSTGKSDRGGAHAFASLR